MSQAAAQSKKVSFRAKEATVCPICDENHQKEQMFQGGGRLIAGKLAQDLRRNYEKNKKFGRVSPLDYVMTVCPRCYYSAFPKDWSTLNPQENEAIRKQTDIRKSYVEKILGPLDFHEDRNIATGAASYLLAYDCYQLRGASIAPTPKKAVCAIRGAWYFSDLQEEFPQLGYDKIRDLLYQKAAVIYGTTLELMQNGQEPVDTAAGMLGPDTDNNWGFDGVIYLNAFLTKKFKDQLAPKPEDQVLLLSRAKRTLARLYGSGKSSKGKPGPIIEMCRELYDEYNAIIEELGGEK
ncbi:hypothetical protein LPTSP4_17540 [Leptospira ryugenii]|uniref:PF09986 family protein n=1 Tax=Leptospira ryugenii TaxID=1917863 RepID=A0A2P2E033_9LEPT|nr:DUF2225 domain-containing protein [Leptospira ryugenii]GBF50230.1 hypothetical protein LPTSP4_17540 [Leptospira ryugenii]